MRSGRSATGSPDQGLVVAISERQDGVVSRGVRCGDGVAVDADLVRAAETAARAALAAVPAPLPSPLAVPLPGDHADMGALDPAPPDLAVVFACGVDPDDVSAALVRAAEVTGAATVLGCSAAGVIGGGRGIELTSAVSVWVAHLPGVTVRSYHLEVMRTSEAIAVVGMPPTRDDDRAAVLLVDPYSFPVDAFVDQLHAALPGLPLCGGNASGLRGPGSTRLFIDGVVHNRGAVGLVLGGDLTHRTVVSQGCRPVGPTMTVTAADGNVILGLAGTTALAKLEQVLADLPPAEQALVTTGLQLGVAMNEYADDYGPGDFLVRGVLGADQERGGLIVGDVVSVGQTVQLQVRDAESADADLTDLLAKVEGEVAGVLLFSCTGRGAALFGTADHDVRVVKDAFGAAGVGGFFAAGEIGPVGGRNHLHGFTASLLAFVS